MKLNYIIITTKGEEFITFVWNKNIYSTYVFWSNCVVANYQVYFMGEMCKSAYLGADIMESTR